MKIGEKCFRIGNERRDDGVCRITNCPNLRQLEIGDWSFLTHRSFNDMMFVISDIKIVLKIVNREPLALRSAGKDREETLCVSLCYAPLVLIN